MKGTELKKVLGLENYPYCWIQKIINVGLPIFIVSVDSRRPNVYLSMYRVNTIHSTVIRRLKRTTSDLPFLNKLKLTPPLLIEHSELNLSENAIVIIRDIAGEYLKNKSVATYI